MRALAGKIYRKALQRYAGTITHVATTEPLVALTFDDGPDPETTPALLEILRGHGARATFFMTGEHAATRPALVEAVREAGHAIGNHSWDHPSFPLISAVERREQIGRTATVLRAADTALFRPPYGHQTRASRFDAWWMRHQVVTWNVCVPDWENHDGAWLAEFALSRIRAGSIVLMHDGVVDFADGHHNSRGATLDAVDRILGALSEDYEFVTVPALLRRGKPVRVKWLMEPDLGMLNSLNRKSGGPRRYQVV